MNASQEDLLIAVPSVRAAALTGISERRLLSWGDLGLVGPASERQISPRNTVRLYGFPELVELRVVNALLESGKSVQQVRRVVQYLRSRGYAAPLVELRFAVQGREIFFQHPDGTWEGDRAPDQVVLEEVLNLELIRSQLRKELRGRRSKEDTGRVVRERKVMGSKPTIAGTRTPLSAIEPYVLRGFSNRRIKQAFPHLSAADIEAARKQLATAG